jgi:hypothetical protein
MTHGQRISGTERALRDLPDEAPVDQPNRGIHTVTLVPDTESLVNSK